VNEDRQKSEKTFRRVLTVALSILVMSLTARFLLPDTHQHLKSLAKSISTFSIGFTVMYTLPLPKSKGRQNP
jgi:hypothetical protein